MPAATVFEKEDLYESISIENWIMPAVYGKNIDRISWIRPPWAAQIPNGTYTFNVGDCDDKIRTDSTLEYFVSDGCYKRTDQLKNKTELALEVVEIGDYKDSGDQCYILDIDLDYFSTHNPFLDIYQDAGTYERLGEIFISPDLQNLDRKSPEEIEEVAQKREKKLDYLEVVFNYLDRFNNLDNFLTDYELVEDEEYFKDIFVKVQTLSKDIIAAYPNEKVDWLVVFDAGCTKDVTELPHHESSKDQIEKMIIQFEEFLRKLTNAPTIVTISRSSEDDYTPSHQVEMIQGMVLDALNNVFPSKVDKPILCYQE
jgi:hypothetical protein